MVDPGLVYSMFLGGSQYDTNAVGTVDGQGSVYVTGNTGSTDFPTTPGAFGTTIGGLDAAGRRPLGRGPGDDIVRGRRGHDVLRGGPQDDALFSIDGTPDADHGGPGLDRCRADPIDVQIGCERG